MDTFTENRRWWMAACFLLILCVVPDFVLGAERLDRGWLAAAGLAEHILPRGLRWEELAKTRLPAILTSDSDLRQVRGRMCGEFEHQHALLLGCRELVEGMPDLFMQIVRHTRGKVSIVALVADVEEYQYAKMLLRSKGIAADHVRFAEIMHDTLWARDYGPMIVDSPDRGPIVLDADYGMERCNDDRVPLELGRLLKLPVVTVPLTIEGGNLLTNGDGLAIVTDQFLEKNITADEDENSLLATLQNACGFRQVVVLQSLLGEPTGHVDMFATFTSPTTVLVGAYRVEQDAENAAILDRNAARLRQVRTSQGPLRVVRVPMPPRRNNTWPTYTNVVYANGVVLVPIYPSLDQVGRRRALDIFSQALPTWKVVGIDATQIIKMDGALHCMTMNLGAIGQLPAFPKPCRKRVASEAETSELAVDPGCPDRKLMGLERAPCGAGW